MLNFFIINFIFLNLFNCFNQKLKKVMKNLKKIKIDKKVIILSDKQKTKVNGGMIVKPGSVTP